MKIKKNFGAHLFSRPVLVTKFGLSVSSVWSPCLVESLIIIKWLCDFQNNVASYILHSLLRSLNQKEKLKRNCFALIYFSSMHFYKVNLIFNTYKCLFFSKLLLRIFNVGGQKMRQHGNGKVLKSATFQIRKFIMTPKWLVYVMSTNLPRHRLKWK